jgi:hypothetical protein
VDVTVAVFDPATGAVVPPLSADESLVCLACGIVISAADADADVGETVRESGVATCFGCGGRTGFERTVVADEKRSVAQRWGSEVAATGWTPMPSLLYRHARDLGLKPTDLAVIGALEDYRWSGLDESVYPSRETMASHIGSGLSALDASLVRLESAGLIELHTRHRSGGWQTSNLYTRDGLSNTLTLLARSPAAGSDHAAALAELLAGLRHEGEQRRQIRLEAGHTESKDHEAEQRNKDKKNPSLKEENNLLHGSRNPKGQERRAA